MTSYNIVQLLILASVTGVSVGVLKADASQQVLDVVNSPNLYNKDIMPFRNRSGPLTVYSTLYFRNVDVDDVNMVVHIDLTFRMSWEDTRLTYSAPANSRLVFDPRSGTFKTEEVSNSSALPEEGVPHVRFSDVSKFWVPDVFFRDSLKTVQMKTVYPEEFIQVSNKGEMLFSTRLLLSLKCSMNLSRFPHDVQTCTVSFASYGHTLKDIIFEFQKSDDVVSIATDMFVSGRFAFKDFSLSNHKTETATGKYSCLEVSLQLERKFSSYLFEWYFPCMCHVVIALCSEFMEPSSLLPRLFLTVGPLLVLTSSSLSFMQHIASVPYIRAFDLFNGISLLVIFTTVLHVIVSYYYLTKPDQGEDKPDIEPDTKMKKFFKKLKENANAVTRGVIIVFYAAFIFLYFLAYST